MSIRAKKLPIFQGLCTNADFAKRKVVLMHELFTEKRNEYKSTILLNIGWLYDQWALISSIRQKKIYQKKAREHFKRALRNGAEKWIAFNGLGTVDLHSRNYRRALQFYGNLHKLHKSPISYNALGNVYRQLGKLSIAKSNYKHALKKAKNGEEQSAALYNLIQLSKEIPLTDYLNEKTYVQKYARNLRRLAKKFPIAMILNTRLNNSSPKFRK